MPELLVQNVKHQLDDSSFHIPPLPHVAVEALALAQNDDSTARQLADLIYKDQALAASLLRLANSAAYGGSRSIVSLQQAITLLGMQTIAEMAITICVKGSVFSKSPYKALTNTLWGHSLATALFAKEVARQQRKNVEAAYLCGLLHRIGMPIVLSAIQEVQSGKELLDETSVQEVLQSLHVDIGVKASTDWQLPEQVSSAIANNADFENATEHRHIAAVIHLSSALASQLLTGDEIAQEEMLPVLEELSIYPNDLDTIMKHQERIEAAIA